MSDHRDADVDGERVRIRRLPGENADGFLGREKWVGCHHDGDNWVRDVHVYLPLGATHEQAAERLYGAGVSLLDPDAPEPAAHRDRGDLCRLCGRAAGSHPRDPARSFETVLCDGSRLIL